MISAEQDSHSALAPFELATKLLLTPYTFFVRDRNDLFLAG
jgi:hypothetical protein